MRAILAALPLCLIAFSAEADMAGDVTQNVRASYYKHGARTANGEQFRPLGMTCAHRTLPFGTRLRVLHRGRSAVCRVNDRGPFVRGRTIDLSLGVAQALGMTGVGVARVTIERM